MTHNLVTQLTTALEAGTVQSSGLDIQGPWDVILILVGLIFGLLAGATAHTILTKRSLSSARTEAEGILESARREAEAKAQKIELEAEKKAKEQRERVDQEVSESLAELKKSQERASKREETLDKRFEQIERRESKLESRDQKSRQALERAETVEAEVTQRREELTERLSTVAELSREDAVEAYMVQIREECAHEGNHLTRTILEEAENKARSEAQEITLMAIQRYASENVSESTVRTVKIPSDDMKGRIIGREGRNIRAIERATGADILVDDTPGVISVSCFDPIRRTIAAESLQRLVADGRVHPSRVEDLVLQTKRDVDERIKKAGSDAIVEANIRGLHGKIVEAMGKLHFRTSYGQNVLRHSVEVAFLSQIIADQLGLDGQVARRCGFLHDIGKAMDHEIEGGHPAIGMEFAKKFGEKSEAVLNAIGGHHNDIPSTTPYTPIVMAADAISGARPGARRESMELYVKRLEQLEAIATAFEPVDEAFAVQAGREVRVIVDARKADDDTTFAIAKDIAKRVEEEMTFPGEIKVTVLREIRAEASAR
ncbi:MAG: ribonuclease Y [Phycisphaerales bacterium]|nr:ribonuclease Y [Phycisphaerales bacterium]